MAAAKTKFVDTVKKYAIDWDFAEHKAHGLQGGDDFIIRKILGKQVIVKTMFAGDLELIAGGISLVHSSGWRVNARDGVEKVWHAGKKHLPQNVNFVSTGGGKWLHLDITSPKGVRYGYREGLTLLKKGIGAI